MYCIPSAFTVKKLKQCSRIQVAQIPCVASSPAPAVALLLVALSCWWHICSTCSCSAMMGFWFLTLAMLRNVIKLDLLHCSLTSGKLHLWFLVQWKGANYLFKCSFNVLQWHKAWVQPPACPNLPEAAHSHQPFSFFLRSFPLSLQGTCCVPVLQLNKSTALFAATGSILTH